MELLEFLWDKNSLLEYKITIYNGEISQGKVILKKTRQKTCQNNREIRKPFMMYCKKIIT